MTGLVAIVDSHTDNGRLIYASGAAALLEALNDVVDGTLDEAETVRPSGSAAQLFDTSQKQRDPVPTGEI